MYRWLGEKENETWDECEQKIQSLFKDKVGIEEENTEIEPAHQTNKEKGEQ